MSESELPKLPTGLYWKRGSIWVSVCRNMQQHHRPTNSTSVQAALAVRDTLLREVLAGERQNAGTGHVTGRELLDAYLDRLGRTSREGSATYAITKMTVDKHLYPFFGARRASKITRTVLEEYRDLKASEGLSGVSINRQLGYLRTAFRIGQKDRMVNQVPDFSTTIIRRLEVENARQGVVTEDQYDRLLPSLPIHVRALFALTYNTGIRPAEAFRLEWSQVDWAKRLIVIYSRQAKTGKPRFLPVRKRMLNLLREWFEYSQQHTPRAKFIFTHPIEDRVMTKNDYRAAWDRARKKIGCKGLLFYDARRAFRSYLPDDVSESDGKSVMGHTQTTTFERYNVAPARAAERVRRALDNEAQKKTATDGSVADLEKLMKWLDEGKLTPEEFAAMKRLVLGV